MLIEIKRFQTVFVACVLFSDWFSLDFTILSWHFVYYYFIPFLIILQLIIDYSLKTYVMIILLYGAVGESPTATLSPMLSQILRFDCLSVKILARLSSKNSKATLYFSLDFLFFTSHSIQKRPQVFYFSLGYSFILLFLKNAYFVFWYFCYWFI